MDSNDCWLVFVDRWGVLRREGKDRHFEREGLKNRKQVLFGGVFEVKKTQRRSGGK